ncbi:MAG: TetR family transcriptional regulator [Thermomicrobiales bacterium]
MVDRVPSERADAAQNRRRILAAAAQIAQNRGVAHLSMDEVAVAAGVGVGTVYRRFGDRAGLAYALLDERERGLQRAFLQGPPPLGPGAPATVRIRAFLHALVDRTEEQVDMLVFAETSTPTARFDGGTYAVYRQHVTGLLAQASPDVDADYLAEALLAPLAASLFLYQRRERKLTIERIKAGLDDLLAGIVP